QAPLDVPGEAVRTSATSTCRATPAGTGHRRARGADVHPLRVHVGASPGTGTKATAVSELRRQSPRRAGAGLASGRFRPHWRVHRLAVGHIGTLSNRSPRT